MSLDDRTNETIKLSMPGQGSLTIDVDLDSSIWPEPWVWIMVDGPSGDSEWAKLTLEEAGRAHDRLGVILGRLSIDRNLLHIPHGPAGVDEDEADAAYLSTAADRIARARLMGYNLTQTAAGIIRHFADQLKGKQ